MESLSTSESSPEKLAIPIVSRQAIKKLYPILNEPNVSTDGESVNESTRSSSRQRRKSTPCVSERQNQKTSTSSPPEVVETVRSVHWIILFIFVSIVAFKCFGGTKEQEPVKKISCSEFMTLRDSFPDQDKKLFKSLKTGVESTLNKPSEPSVFSLFSTDENLINIFMTNVISATKSCLNSTESHISLTSDQLNDKLITNYKDELVKKKVMVIANVDEASPESATSLHSFCDTFNPVSSDSVIFLTIHVPSHPTGKHVEYITNYLQNRWKNLADNIRMPLISRILDQTFFLKP